jgi:hypothetical protein
MAERRMPLQVHRIKQERTRETLKLKRRESGTPHPPTEAPPTAFPSMCIHLFAFAPPDLITLVSLLVWVGFRSCGGVCATSLLHPCMFLPLGLSSTMGMVANIPKLIRSNSKYREMLFSSKKDS